MYALFSLFSLFLTASSTFGTNPDVYVIRPPTFVYRSDLRPPDLIFEEGMKSFGDNDNVYRHVTGESCNNPIGRNSAFIATSTSKEFVKLWGEQKLYVNFGTGPKPEFLYVYKIRASENFYDCVASLMTGEKLGNPIDREYHEGAVNKYKYQLEWLAHLTIPPDQFHSVDIYKKKESSGTAIKQGEGLELVKNEESDKYVDASTQGSSKPYQAQSITNTGVSSVPTGRAFTVPTRVRDRVTGAFTRLTACFAPCVCKCSRQSSRIESMV